MVKTVIEMAKKCFEIRSCNHALTEEKIEKGEFNTAVDFYIGNCKGCCQGKVSVSSYNERIQHVKSALNGEFSKVLRELKKEMESHASVYQFEEANEVKSKIKHIQNFNTNLR